ncbi:unnamed protein product [Moneuplotes crassus]|uniref:Uncharacterized protein n=1 Tax=Euplotes crassus TaxID=5936 RepID=A0AAD2D6T8_EUPCR|nr:unnamed protein product [Moneuplotes crassus]
MELPKCQADPCENRPEYYLKVKETYVCRQHKNKEYSAADCVLLVSPEELRMHLKSIDLCRKQVSPSTLGYLSPEEEYKEFDETIKERAENILSGLKAICQAKAYYEVEPFVKEVKELRDFLVNHELFKKYTAIKTWKESLAATRNVATNINALEFKRLGAKYIRAVEHLLNQNYVLKAKLVMGNTKNINESKHDEDKMDKPRSLTRRISLKHHLRTPKKVKRSSSLLQNKKKSFSRQDMRRPMRTPKPVEEEKIPQLVTDIKKKPSATHGKTSKDGNPSQTLKKPLANLEEEKQSIMHKHPEEENKFGIFRETKHKAKGNSSKKLVNEHNIHEQKIDNIKDLNKSQIYEEQTFFQKDTARLHVNKSALEEEKETQNTKITELEKEIKRTRRDLNLALRENELLEQLAPFTTYTQKEFAALCRSIDSPFLKGIFGGSGEIRYKEGDTSFRLDLDETPDLNLIKKVKKRIPNLEYFSIRYFQPEKSELINNFLKNYFPNKVQNFELYPSCFSSNRSEDYYMEGLLAIASRVQKKLVIGKFHISQQNLGNLLSKFKHVECLRFYCCKIYLPSVPTLEEALWGAQIQRLELIYSRPCRAYITNFEKLIKGFSQSEDFRKSLKEINVQYLLLDEEDISSILEENGFGKVKIYGACSRFECSDECKGKRTCECNEEEWYQSDMGKQMNRLRIKSETSICAFLDRLLFPPRILMLCKCKKIHPREIQVKTEEKNYCEELKM